MLYTVNEQQARVMRAVYTEKCWDELTEFPFEGRNHTQTRHVHFFLLDTASMFLICICVILDLPANSRFCAIDNAAVLLFAQTCSHPEIDNSVPSLG